LALLTAELLAPFAVACRVDLLAPVPLHPGRLRTRGFNQALLLAELLSATWQLPLQRQPLRRVRGTTPQTELSSDQRALNLLNAFSVPDSASIRDKRIMLVDDVFTTGATLAECSRSLLKAGASAVCCVTVARAPDPNL
jgi:ComF family protein